MTDIEKLKLAFQNWLAEESLAKWKLFRETFLEMPVSPLHAYGNLSDCAAIFWPFVEYVLNEPEQSIRNIELINQLKYDLGMTLMAHEERGVKK